MIRPTLTTELLKHLVFTCHPAFVGHVVSANGKEMVKTETFDSASLGGIMGMLSDRADDLPSCVSERSIQELTFWNYLSKQETGHSSSLLGRRVLNLMVNMVVHGNTRS